MTASEMVAKNVDAEIRMPKLATDTQNGRSSSKDRSIEGVGSMSDLEESRSKTVKLLECRDIEVSP